MLKELIVKIHNSKKTKNRMITMYRYPVKQKKIKETEKEIKQILAVNSVFAECSHCKKKIKLSTEESERIIQCASCNIGFFKKLQVERDK